jgi:hypothetical protein
MMFVQRRLCIPTLSSDLSIVVLLSIVFLLRGGDKNAKWETCGGPAVGWTSVADQGGGGRAGNRRRWGRKGGMNMGGGKMGRGLGKGETGAEGGGL